MCWSENISDFTIADGYMRLVCCKLDYFSKRNNTKEGK